MILDLFHAGECIGSVVRSVGNAFAYAPTGVAVGQLADSDAAAAALARRQQEAA